MLEANIVAQGSVNAVMDGKQYNRSLRCHKLVMEAMERVRWDAFCD